MCIALPSAQFFAFSRKPCPQFIVFIFYRLIWPMCKFISKCARFRIWYLVRLLLHSSARCGLHYSPRYCSRSPKTSFHRRLRVTLWQPWQRDGFRWLVKYCEVCMYNLHIHVTNVHYQWSLGTVRKFRRMSAIGFVKARNNMIRSEI